jgi:hypothetical protein
MRNNSLKLLVGAALAAGTGLAIAQISPPPPSSSPSTSPSTGSPSTGSPSASPSAGGAAGASGETFTKLDSDKDGMVSKKEASKNKDLTGKWDTLDTNKDGKLDQGEFAAFETGSSSGSGSTPKY